jgi:hypothetical protein
MTDCQNDNKITIQKRGYGCLRVVYTLCQGLESDGRNFLAAIVPNESFNYFTSLGNWVTKILALFSLL